MRGNLSLVLRVGKQYTHVFAFKYSYVIVCNRTRQSIKWSQFRARLHIVKNSYLIGYADSYICCGNKSASCIRRDVVVSIDWTAVDDPADLCRRIGAGSLAEHGHIVSCSGFFGPFDRYFGRSDCGKGEPVRRGNTLVQMRGETITAIVNDYS